MNAKTSDFQSLFHVILEYGKSNTPLDKQAMMLDTKYKSYLSTRQTGNSSSFVVLELWSGRFPSVLSETDQTSLL